MEKISKLVLISTFSLTLLGSCVKNIQESKVDKGIIPYLTTGEDKYLENPQNSRGNILKINYEPFFFKE